MRLTNATLVALAAIAALTVVSLASQPPAPGESKAGEVQEDHAGRENRGAEIDLQATATIVTGGDSEANEQADERDQKASSNWLRALADCATPDGWIAIFTLVLTVVAVLQFCHLVKDEGRRTRLERPWLTVKGTSRPVFMFDPDKEHARTVWVFAPWSIDNVGKSPAWVYQQTVRIARVADFPPDASPPRVADEEPPFADLPIPPGASHAGSRPGVEWTPQEAREIGPGWHFIRVYGTVRYRDAAGDRHFTRFCFEWRLIVPHDTPGNQVWDYSPVGPSAYVEYT